MIRRSGFKCCLSKRRHRIKRQSLTPIILLTNNIVAIIDLFEYKKYTISTFLLEPLAKKVCSVSFVSQYIMQGRKTTVIIYGGQIVFKSLKKKKRRQMKVVGVSLCLDNFCLAFIVCRSQPSTDLGLL